jgi:hypothetical protein
VRLAFLAAAMLPPSLALANGGPVAWGGGGPRGSVRSVENAAVRLVSEDLLLELDADGKHYHAQARYVLENGGEPQEVDYGVPVAVPVTDVLNGAELDHRQIRPADLAAIAQRIRIDVAGKRVGCEIPPGSVHDDPVHRDPGAEPAATDYLASGWCVTKLEIPHGEAIPLLLEYDGDLAFIDWSFTKSAFVEYGARTLHWPLAPAGHWAGRPERVTIRLDPGPFVGLVSVTPPPSGTSDDVLAWDLARPDLRSAPDLVVTVDARPFLRHRELVASRTEGWLGKGVTLLARASSTLPLQGKVSYAASKAVDRDAGTAWCAGKKGGAGEWLEVRVERIPQGTASCRLEGYVVVPGYAKSLRTWTRNNRLRSFRIGPCDGTGHGTAVNLLDPGQDPGAAWDPLRLSARPDSSAVLVKKPLEDAACARLTVIEVAHGESDDTCISEFRPAFNCG